jgi:hypothetical protein
MLALVNGTDATGEGLMNSDNLRKHIFWNSKLSSESWEVHYRF